MESAIQFCFRQMLHSGLVDGLGQAMTTHERKRPDQLLLHVSGSRHTPCGPGIARWHIRGGGLAGGLQWLGTPGHMINTVSEQD